jgi:glycosyltransferase involved in cell wall biosynthesis/GT2 family glycosyltransferase
VGFLEPHLKCYGGIRRVLEFANRLVARGHEVTFFLPDEQPKRCDWMPCRARIVGSSEGRDRELDVLVFNHEPQWHVVLGFTNVRARVFYALHHGALYDKAGAYESARLPVERLLANSQWTAEMLERETGQRSHVVLSGIDPELFHPVSVRKRYQVLHYGDRRRLWKGTADVEAACAMLGIKPISYDGRGLPQRKMAREYSRARVFVSGSWFEGFGQPGLEALACGTPLVTTDSGGCREYAIHEQTALVVPAREPRALSAAIARVLEDPSLAERLVHNGLELVRERFSWERCTSQLEEELRLAAATPRSERSWFVTERRLQLERQAPTLSIVSPAWNQLPLTQTFVESIRRHTTVPYELILIDNGSQPLARDYVERAADVAIVNPENRGFAVAMNQGLARARGSVVAFMNNDTRVSTGWAERLIETLHGASDTGLVVPAVTAAGNAISVRTEPGTNVTRLPLFADPPSGVVYVMPTDVARAIGGFSEEYPIASGEDVDLCFQVWVNGLAIVLDERVLVEHTGKGTAHALEDQRALWRRNREIFLRKWTGAPRVNFLHRITSLEHERLLAAAQGAAAWMERYFAKRDEFVEYREQRHGKRKRKRARKPDAGPPVRKNLDGRRRWIDKKLRSLKRRFLEPVRRLFT